MSYSVTCACGVTITAATEKSLLTAYKRHVQTGVIHKDQEEKWGFKL